MSDKKDQNLTDKEVNMEGARDEGKTYIEGQNREMIINSKEDKKKDIRNPLVWLIPVMVIILIIPLMIFHIGGDGEGGEETADTGAEVGESGEDSDESEEPVDGEEGAQEEAVEDEEGTEEADGGEGTEEEDAEEGNGASSGDVDAEGVAQNSCASCHGEDFSGGMGPALAGTDLSEDEFTDIVRNGEGSMPAFDEDEVSDEELTAMYDMWSE